MQFDTAGSMIIFSKMR